MILALTPGISEPELYAVCAAVVTAVVSWIVYAQKMKRRCGEFSTALDKQRAEAESTLATVEKTASEQQAEAQKDLRETSAKLADVEQRFATHRQVADRRQTDASLQISRLEGDVATAREMAAQLVPTQERIKDLERALMAEQGRVQAQEQAIQATNARAADFEKRLGDAQDLVMKHKGEMQEAAVELKKARDEQAAYLAAGGVEAELAKAREATQQAEARNASLQRALKVAETRAEMVQKEFMNAVGMASAPVVGASLHAASAGDKKVRELEEKVAQLESEARKRSREDGYKIAELEYRLSEALEAANAASPAPAPAAAPAPSSAPATEPEAATELLAGQEAAPSPTAEAVAAAPVPEPAPVPSMPAALAPAVVEIPPVGTVEEAVPAQASAAPPEAATAPPELEAAPPPAEAEPAPDTQTEANETTGGVGAEALLKAPESPPPAMAPLASPGPPAPVEKAAAAAG